MTTPSSYSKLDHGYAALKGKRLEDLCSSVSYLCTHLAISWNSVLFIHSFMSVCYIMGKNSLIKSS